MYTANWYVLLTKETALYTSIVDICGRASHYTLILKYANLIEKTLFVILRS